MRAAVTEYTIQQESRVEPAEDSYMSKLKYKIGSDSRVYLCHGLFHFDESAEPVEYAEFVPETGRWDETDRARDLMCGRVTGWPVPEDTAIRFIESYLYTKVPTVVLEKITFDEFKRRASKEFKDEKVQDHPEEEIDRFLACDDARNAIYREYHTYLTDPYDTEPNGEEMAEAAVDSAHCWLDILFE